MVARRILVLGLGLVLAACGQSGADASVPEDDSQIDCALGGSGSFERECAVERSVFDGALFLTVRHPDGGFRRFEVVGDGRGLAVADGAEFAEITVGDGRIDVAVGADRYRFPATIGDAQGG